jgi:hypothetical protein
MLIQTLRSLFRRDLEKLKKEIELFKSEDAVWATGEGITNSAGNLCLHLCGNLSTYIGAQFGETGYVRDRDLEFSVSGVPRAHLLNKIDETIAAVEQGLGKITEAQLAANYPIKVFEDDGTTEWMLVHLATHLNYHLGQVNYHRRLLDK